MLKSNIRSLNSLHVSEYRNVQSSTYPGLSSGFSQMPRVIYRALNWDVIFANPKVMEPQTQHSWSSFSSDLVKIQMAQYLFCQIVLLHGVFDSVVQLKPRKGVEVGSQQVFQGLTRWSFFRQES